MFHPVAEGHAQLADGGVEADIEINEGIGWPECTVQFFPGDEVSGMLEQQREDAARLLLRRTRKPFLRSSLERVSSSNRPNR